MSSTLTLPTGKPLGLAIYRAVSVCILLYMYSRVAVDGYEPMQSSSDPGEQATINPAPVYNYVSTDPRPTTTTNM